MDRWGESKEGCEEHRTEPRKSEGLEMESRVAGAQRVRMSKSGGGSRRWTTQSLVKDFYLYPKINGMYLKVLSRGVT